jgi:hypothetical protein
MQNILMMIFLGLFKSLLMEKTLGILIINEQYERSLEWIY